MQDLCDIWSWNPNASEKVNSPINDPFSRIAEIQADSLATVAHKGELTYRNLDNISTQLAHRLIERDLQNTTLPVHLEKFLWTPAARLAAMKVGAVSAVSGPSQPMERLRIVTDEVHSRPVLASVKNEAVTYNLSDKPALVVGKRSDRFIPTQPT